jgi:7-carboxy-7-deazaguanine synthase
VTPAHAVSLETSGALDIGQVDARVARVVDVKAPGSGESDRNRWQNLALLTVNDEIKFVLKDRSDYEWARQLIVERQLAALCPLLFSPVDGELAAATLGRLAARRPPARTLPVAAAQDSLG